MGLTQVNTSSHLGESYNVGRNKFTCVCTGALLSVVVVVTFSFTFNLIKVEKYGFMNSGTTVN